MRLRIASAASRAATLLAFVAVIAGCSALGLEDGTNARAQLERQKALWVRQHLSSYRYRVACSCFGVAGPVDIEVRGDVVAEASDSITGQPVSLSVLGQLPTVDALFGIIERAITRRADLLDVAYHPTMGYPTRIAVDYSFNSIDDEIRYVASGLTPTPQE